MSKQKTNKETVLEVSNLWEDFRLYHYKNMTIKDTLVRLRRSEYEEFWALKNISFKVHKGETLGIIGENGSGKSTLLKCIAGILTPSKGKIEVRGKISPLLELGAGFHAELSGKENIYVNGAILGLTKKQIDKRYDDIVAFSELENFIDTQVKFYSSGMYIRLGFAIAVFSDPDILLIDEILAVGDASFRKKSFDKMKEFQSKKKTIILVTHDTGTAAQFCDKLALLKNGKLEKIGNPRKIVTNYVAETVKDEKFTERGTKDIVIKNFKILDFNKKQRMKFAPGDKAYIQFEFNANKPIKNPIFGFAINDQQGNHCFGTNTKLKKIKTGLVEGKGNISFEIESLPMLDGKFYITIAVTSENEKKEYHWLNNCLMIKMENPSDDIGSFFVPVKCKLNKKDLSIRLNK